MIKSLHSFSVKVYTEATPNNAIAINLSSIAGVVLLGTVIMVIVTICKCRYVHIFYNCVPCKLYRILTALRGVARGRH